MAEHQVNVVHRRRPQHFPHQANYLDIAFDSGVSVELGADPDRHAGSAHASRPRVQYVVGITQANRTRAIQSMRVYASGLGL